MKLSDFEYDASSGVYISSAEIKQIHYLDGSEQYLKEVLTSAYDLSFFSEELKSKIKDWPSLYHLSPYRATIIDCFDFQNKEETVLELGAGCGAISRWLGEHFQDVRAVEGSFQRASIARLRCRDLSSVKVYTANFYDIDVERQFDIVTLIGVLEYSHLYHPLHKRNPHEAALATLQFAHGAIKNHGVLVLAIENKLGLKYFSGAKEDHSSKLFDSIQGYPDGNTPVTFSAAELDNLLRGAGFTSVDFYLPFPDYKLAKTILNAQELSSHHLYNWIETPFPDRVTGQRILLFNESLALREISKAGLLKDLSNSFLIIAHKGERNANFKKLGFSDHAWIARHYSLDRHRDFCKRASLQQTASGHLRVDNCIAFDTASRTSLSHSFFTHTFTSEEFYPGNLLVFSVFEMIASGKFDSMFQPLLERLNEFLLDRFSTGQKDEMGIPLLSGESLDIALWNIIVGEETGEWIIVDREWTFNGSIPVDFILWRNIYHFFMRYRAYLDQRYSSKSINELTYEILQKIYPSCSRGRCKLAMQFDQSFQNFVNHGIPDIKTFLTAGKSYQKSDSIEDAAQQIEAKTKHQVSIVIPTFNNLELTRRCLETIRQTAGAINYEIIVVDNASTDATPDYLRQEQTAGRLQTILNEENLGFGKACNQGARVATGKYLVFLNNDTVPQPNWLEEMVTLAESDENIGIVGSKLLFPDGTIQHAGVVISANKLPYHIYRNCPGDLAAANKQKDYQIVTAACMLIIRELFFEVSGFEERYINGCEDIDLCLKVGQRNKRVVYNPKSVLIHFEGQSEGRQDKMDFNRRLLLQTWKDKIKQDDIYFLKQDGMELMVEPDGSVTFLPSAPKTKQFKTSVIIVTYNSVPSISACLDSVLQHTLGAEVIVVDNASTDETHAILSEYKDRVTSILNDENKGFSYACNQGIRASKGEYIILLNPDTIVTPMWADRMIDHFKPGVGAVGPLSNYVAALQRLDLYLREPLPAEMEINDFNDLAEKLYKRNCGKGRETKLLMGFCKVLSRKVLDEVGLLDEDLFLGNDDLELSWRLRQHGYRLLIATDTFVYHEGQMSFKSQEASTCDLTQESTDRLFAKLEAHYGVGNVPTPMELWGIDFFRPKGAHFRSAKPTFAAVYCVYDDTSWLTDSIESIYYTVDTIYFLIGEKPWHGESTDNRNTLECIKIFPDPTGKIHLVHGTWTNETDQRNAGLDLLSKAGFTYCFVIDADEIYDPLDLQRMKELIISHPEIACWHIALDTYWKSYRYRIEPREPFKPVVFLKVGAARFTQNRHVGCENHSLIPPEIGICHHMSYARSDAEVLKKITTFSHAHEVQTNWFENVWKEWDIKHSLTNLHPTHPPAYQQAVEQPYSALPPVLKRLYSADAQKSSDMTSSLTSIIILSYNQWDQTELCLKSIEMYTPEPHEIIIVDNGSSDGTIEHLRDHIKANKNVRVISNSTNRGFAGGNNQGINLARGEYILLLNNDTVVTEGWLGRMLNIFNCYPKTGIVGPMSNNVNGPQLITNADYKNFGELVDFAARRMKENDGSSFLVYRVVGFCLLVRREVIDNIGGLDEQFLSGNFEDDDFCIRAILSGYEIRVAQDVFIHHTGSQTFRGASIDHQEKILHNWELFKKKWKIPAERHFDYWELFTTKLMIPVDASPESAYRLPFQPSSGLSLHVPLPDVFYDHKADEDNRWLHEIDVKHQEQRIQGLTSLIINTYDQFNNTKKCIKSIKKNTPEQHEIIIVDNGFSHKTTNWLRKRAHENQAFKVIKGNSNIEYAKACNQAIVESSGEYIILLHDDVVVTDGWLTNMLECLNSVPEAGIVGPMTVNVDGPQKVITTDYNSLENLDRFAKAFREKNRYRRVPSRKISSLCVLFRYKLVNETGLLDDQFDVHDFAIEDFCIRASLEGYKNLVAGDVFLYHYGQESLTEEKTHDADLRSENENLFLAKWRNLDKTI